MSMTKQLLEDQNYADRDDRSDEVWYAEYQEWLYDQERLRAERGPSPFDSVDPAVLAGDDSTDRS